MRTKPKLASDEEWKAFEELADTECYGELTEDWEAWWICFHEGYLTGKLHEKMKGKKRQ
jgi:hypothetical protein